MSIDLREFNELSRRAADLLSDTADVPGVLRNCLGEQHELTHSAERMAASIEAFVRELRSFDVSAEAAAADPYPNSYTV
jgi:hypothetical protein